MDIGDMGVPFIYQGEELIYPEYVKDGLVLHYDFSGMTNNDASKGIARDLSGNGNHGTLQNFNFTPESGYDKNKLLSTGLKFDGVDDAVILKERMSYTDFTLEIICQLSPYQKVGNLFGSRKGVYTGANAGIEIRRNSDSIVMFYIADGENLFTNYKNMGDMTLSPRKITLMRESNILSLFAEDTLVAQYNIPEIGHIVEEDIMAIGSRSTNYTYGDDMKCFSFKFYNRPLTPEEIAHNYAIEKERFSIE